MDRLKMSAAGRFDRRGLARLWLGATAVGVAVIVAACGPADVLFTFDNRTDTVLCDYTSPNAVTAGLCSAELAPRVETKWGRDCDNDAGRPIRVMIATKERGRTIYDRTASCGEWRDTKRTFLIEQYGDAFVVTDSLPIPTPIP